MPYNEVMLFTLKIHLLIEQNTNETKQDISIMKLNISNLYKAIITTECFLFLKKKGLFQLFSSQKGVKVGNSPFNLFFCPFEVHCNVAYLGSYKSNKVTNTLLFESLNANGTLGFSQEHVCLSVGFYQTHTTCVRCLKPV